MAKTTSNLIVKVGKRIRQLRQLRGWSQERLADECGLDRSYIGGVERGERIISEENIPRLAKALGVDPFAFLDFREIKDAKESM